MKDFKLVPSDNVNSHSKFEPNKIGKYYKLTNFTIAGNIIPNHWYHIITRENCKPDQISSTILSELITQHELTGNVKFRMGYEYFKSKFNFTRVQTRESLVRIEKKKLIKRTLETVIENGKKYTGQIFITINKEKIQALLK